MSRDPKWSCDRSSFPNTNHTERKPLDKKELKKKALKAIRSALKYRSKDEVKDALTLAADHRAYDRPGQYSLTGLLDQPRHVAIEIFVLYQQCISQYAPAGSTWARAAGMQATGGSTIPDMVVHLLGVLKGLENAYQSGEFESFEEMVHAESFGDLISQSKVLLKGDFRLAAAVLVGAALEGHLRDIALKHGVSVDGGDNKPRAMSALNAELRRAGAYDKTKEGEILAWIHIRNDAAHNKPEFKNRTRAEIARMAEGVREFIAEFIR